MFKKFRNFSFQSLERIASIKELIQKVESIVPRKLRFCKSKCCCILKNSVMDSDLSKIDPKFVQVYYGEEDKVEIIMQVGESNRRVCRKKDEKLQPALDRIRNNFRAVNAKLAKKEKKSRKNNNPEPDLKIMNDPLVELFGQSGQKIDGEQPAITAWEKANILKVCDLNYTVVCNPPKVEFLRIVSTPMVGMPIHPQIQFREAGLEFSRFSWYKYLPTFKMEDEERDLEETDKNPKQSSKRPKLDSQQVEWTLVGTDKVYVAKPEDVGSILKVSVLPGNSRYPHDFKNHQTSFVQEISAETKGVVVAGPRKCVFDGRHLLTKERCPKGKFRIVTYNILADVYANTDYAQDFLFPHCPVEAIDIDYRQQLIVKEITGYNADIICLQEVDRFVFESYLMPTMSIEGFAGAFGVKDSAKEGCALFYRRNTFKLHMVDNIVLRNALLEERNGALNTKINANLEFRTQFKNRPNSLLVAILQSTEDPTKHLLIGNTHLYWHPRGGAVRSIQTEIILREMRHIKEKFLMEEKDKESDITQVLTGDFNSQPYTAVVQLLTSGIVQSNHADWYSNGKSEFVPDMNLKNSTLFESACGFPSYTNYVTGFQGCLDYIFIEPNHLSVERVIPPPLHSDITRYTALPNETAPSDHIAQVADLFWKTSPVACVDGATPCQPHS